MDDSTTPTGSPSPEVDGDDILLPDEAELLAAFDRLRPQGSLAWGFDDAMHRLVDRAEGRVPPLPWDGLPDDLWERGRSARVGQRFVGDVAGVLAEALAGDTRRAVDAAVGDGLGAAWDALRYLAARVEQLERRVDPLAELVPDLAATVPPPDVSAWVGELPGWLPPLGGERPVVVGESADGALARTLAAAGHRVRAIEPRGPEAWRSMTGGDGTGVADGGLSVSFGEVADALASTPDASVSAVVLAGAVDRLDLPGRVDLLGHALRVTAPGGVVVVLATDQAAWDRAVPVVARDLAPGRPLHPETWLLLLDRLGADDAVWHRPVEGSVHAVVGRVAGGTVRR